MSFLTALVLIGVLTLILIMVEVMFVYSFFGTGYGWSANRIQPKERSPLGNRIKSTLQNQVETNGYAIPVLAVAAIAGLDSNGAMIAALVHVIARYLFPVLYYTGVPFIRLPAWGAGWISIVYIVYELAKANVVFG